MLDWIFFFFFFVKVKFENYQKYPTVLSKNFVERFSFFGWREFYLKNDTIKNNFICVKIGLFKTKNVSASRCLNPFILTRAFYETHWYDREHTVPSDSKLIRTFLRLQLLYFVFVTLRMPYVQRFVTSTTGYLKIALSCFRVFTLNRSDFDWFWVLCVQMNLQPFVIL